MTQASTDRHSIERVRREPRRRSTRVVEVIDLTPTMRRIVVAADSLKDFESAGADDHVKLFFTVRGESGDETVMRDFTPRAFDRDAGTLTIDFALHLSGPASDWARSVSIGASLEIGGPRGSLVVSDDFDWYLLVGDETALPAIGRRLEELRADVPVHCILLADDAQSKLNLATRAAASTTWLLRDKVGQDDALSVRSALRDWVVPTGDGYVFAGAEASVAQAVKEFMLGAGHNPQWIRASGYWSRDGQPT